MNYLDRFSFEIAQAFSRKQTINDLRSHQMQVSEHAAKIMLLPNHESSNHRAKELVSFLGKCWRLSNTKSGKLKKEFYEEILYEDPFGDIPQVQGVVQIVERDYGKLNYKPDFESLQLHYKNLILESYLRILAAEDVKQILKL